MTENICEIGTTVLAHVVCTPQESGVLLSDFATAYPSVNHSWIFSVLENTGLPALSLTLPAKYLQRQHDTRGICGSRDGFKRHLFQGTLTIWSSSSLHNVFSLTISPLLHHLSVN